MRHPSELMASSQISLHYWDGVCEESAALLMSSFHLTFLPPVSLDSFIFAIYATSSQSGSHAELGGRAGGWAVVTLMWGEHLSDCHFAVLLWMIDSGLKMMAWHNHLPSQLSSSRELSLSPSFSLCLSLLSSSECMRGVETFILLWTDQCAYDDDYEDEANDRWDFCPPHQSWLSALSLTVTPWPFRLPSPLFTQQPLSLRPLKLALAVRREPNQDMLQGRGINHSPEQEPRQAWTHIHHPRFTPHIEAQPRNLDPLHQVIFKLVIDLPITEWIICCQRCLGAAFTVAWLVLPLICSLWMDYCLETMRKQPVLNREQIGKEIRSSLPWDEWVSCCHPSRASL